MQHGGFDVMASTHATVAAHTTATRQRNAAARRKNNNIRGISLCKSRSLMLATRNAFEQSAGKSAANQVQNTSYPRPPAIRVCQLSGLFETATT